MTFPGIFAQVSAIQIHLSSCFLAKWRKLMTEENAKALVGQDLIEATRSELAVNPQAETGCCTVTTKGWSENYPDITKEACNKKAAPGFTTTWKKGDC